MPVIVHRTNGSWGKFHSLLVPREEDVGYEIVRPDDIRLSEFVAAHNLDISDTTEPPTSDVEGWRTFTRDAANAWWQRQATAGIPTGLGFSLGSTIDEARSLLDRLSGVQASGGVMTFVWHDTTGRNRMIPAGSLAAAAAAYQAEYADRLNAYNSAIVTADDPTSTVSQLQSALTDLTTAWSE